MRVTMLSCDKCGNTSTEGKKEFQWTIRTTESLLTTSRKKNDDKDLCESCYNEISIIDKMVQNEIKEEGTRHKRILDELRKKKEEVAYTWFNKDGNVQELTIVNSKTGEISKLPKPDAPVYTCETCPPKLCQETDCDECPYESEDS